MKALLILSVCLVSLLLARPVAAAGGEPQTCFLREGDVWVFLGDSITHADTYRRIVDRVVKHFHPEASLRITQKGVSGSLATASKEQFEKAAREDRPTIVSLMTGMNNSINSAWRVGEPMDKHIAGYREQIAKFVQNAKDKGLDVVLLSPTLTDESLGWGSMWALDGTEEFLRRCAAAVKDVAAAETTPYIPASEEFELAEARGTPEQIFRPDGVHPAAAGQYAIAASILKRIAPWAPLGKGEGDRTLCPAPQPLPVELKLPARFAKPQDKAIPLTLATTEAVEATLTWSLGDGRGQEALKLDAGETAWSLALPEVFSLQNGDAAEAVIDLVDAQGRRAVYVLDLARVPVLHLKDGKVSGTILAPEGTERPEGRPAAQWTLSVVDGKSLLIEAEVFDSEIRSDADWPWAQDGLIVWLDYRPTERFADIGLDSDVYMFLLNAYEQPRFAVSLRPWTGRGITGAAVAGGERTQTGYHAHLAIADGKGQMRRFSKHQESDLSKRDFLGVSLVVIDQDTDANARSTTRHIPNQATARPHDQYANTHAIVDLKGKLPGDSVVNVSVTRVVP